MSELNSSPEFEEKVRRSVAVPDARPEFVNRLRSELAGRPIKMKSGLILRPAWVFVFVLLVIALVASTPAAVNALKRLLGYVPEVGLVENTGSLRMLAEPVSVTREGVTLTVTSVLAYPDRVELIYETAGIQPANDGGNPQNADDDPKAFCGPASSFDGNYLSDGDAALRLPDGTLIQRMFGNEYPQNVFAMKPVYKTSLPAEVTELTLVLKCIPWSRLGSVPENWEIPFQLVPVAEGVVVGEPVVEVEVTSVATTPEADPVNPALPAPAVTMTLERVVPLEAATVFYLSLNMENPDPSLVSIMPVNVYVIDSLGQKIQLIGNFPWQPFEHRPGTAFEYTSQTKPAEGTLALVVAEAVAYYAPLYVKPQQATPDEMSFTFDAGLQPQPGQTWQVDQEFEIAGYPIRVLSARAVTFADIQTPAFIDGSQGYEYGYEFTVQGDPSVKMQVHMDIMSESPMCWLSNESSFVPDSSSIHYVQLCREAYPTGNVRVTIGELSVLIENTWQASWSP